MLVSTGQRGIILPRDHQCCLVFLSSLWILGDPIPMLLNASAEQIREMPIVTCLVEVEIVLFTIGLAVASKGIVTCVVEMVNVPHKVGLA